MVEQRIAPVDIALVNLDLQEISASLELVSTIAAHRVYAIMELAHVMSTFQDQIVLAKTLVFAIMEE